MMIIENEMYQVRVYVQIYETKCNEKEIKKLVIDLESLTGK